MTRRRLLLIAICSVLVLSGAMVLGVRRDRPSSIPTAPVTRGTFQDFLQLRGEIRPLRSMVLTAPSSGADLQIVELVRNGATVAAGDVIVQFDPTTQVRTLEQKQSELKQAESARARP